MQSRQKLVSVLFIILVKESAKFSLESLNVAFLYSTELSEYSE